MLANSRNQFSSKIFVAAVLIILLSFLWALAAAPSAYAYEDEEVAFLSLINDYRAQNGLPALTISNSLFNASENHSYDMGSRNYFSHNTPEGVTPWDRIRAAGYTYNTWLGENIAAGYVSAQTVFDAWRNSPSHNVNMLSGNYRAIGIGRSYVANSTYGYYWTTDFGGVAETVPPTDTQMLAKWNALGGAPGGYTSDVKTISGGKYQDFSNGRLYFNEAAGQTYWVHGGIMVMYFRLVGHTGPYGLPTSDEMDATGAPGGRQQNFEAGRLYWGPTTSTHGLQGTFLEKFDSHGGPALNGLPTTDAYPAWGGWAQNMQGAYVTIESGQNTAKLVRGGVFAKYQMLGGPSGVLHLITAEEHSISVRGATDAVQADFQNGYVFWSRETSSHPVNGGIYIYYLRAGGPTGALGLPVTDEYDIALRGGGRRQQFQHGFITWGALYGTWVDYR